MYSLPEAAKAITDYRKKEGIITDFGELQSQGVKPEVVTFLKDKTYLGSLTVLSRETVGPQVGKDLRRKAVLATIWSLIGMLVYIALRFKLANQAGFSLDATEREMFAVLVRYLGAIQFWKDRDSGAWEESRKINSSSVGAVTAGLLEMDQL